MPLTFILRAATVHYLFVVTQHSMLTITAIIRVNRHVLATSMELGLDQIAYNDYCGSPDTFQGSLGTENKLTSLAIGIAVYVIHIPGTFSYMNYSFQHDGGAFVLPYKTMGASVRGDLVRGAYVRGLMSVSRMHHGFRMSYLPDPFPTEAELAPWE